jgi:hypothetical protein
MKSCFCSRKPREGSARGRMAPPSSTGLIGRSHDKWHIFGFIQETGSHANLKASVCSKRGPYSMPLSRTDRDDYGIIRPSHWDPPKANYKSKTPVKPVYICAPSKRSIQGLTFKYLYCLSMLPNALSIKSTDAKEVPICHSLLCTAFHPFRSRTIAVSLPPIRISRDRPPGPRCS